MKESSSSAIRVHLNFKKRLDNYIREYEKLNKIKISYCDATKIIDEKIEDAGGLVL